MRINMMNEMMRLIQLFDQVKELRIAVIGDLILDEYTYGCAGKVSTGIQIPIIEKKNQVNCLGGAGNVASNIAALCRNTCLMGQIGDDGYKHLLEDLLIEHNVSFHAIETNQSIVKQRIYVSDQQVMRLDSGINSELSIVDIEQKLDDISPDIIVLVDYGYGVVNERTIRTIQEYKNKKEKEITSIFSSRNMTRYDSNDFEIIVVNKNEIEGIKAFKNTQQELYVTCGAEGISYKKDTKEVYGRQSAKMNINVSGAGDTALAIIACLCRTNASVEEILRLANLAAGIAVETKETYALSVHEIIEHYYEQLFSIDFANKIVNEEVVTTIVDAWKMQNKRIVFTNGCYDILHYGHFMSLDYAKKLGDKLIVGINTDESVKRIKGEERPINNLEKRMRTLSCLEMVDAIVAFESDTAIELVSLIDPDIYAKGEEYKEKELPEAEYVKEIVFISMEDGYSTTKQIERIKDLTKK